METAWNETEIEQNEAETARIETEIELNEAGRDLWRTGLCGMTGGMTPDRQVSLKREVSGRLGLGISY